MGYKPTDVERLAPLRRCPWCVSYIQPEERSTERFGVAFHSGCYADLTRSDTEVEEMRGGLQ